MDKPPNVGQARGDSIDSEAELTFDRAIAMIAVAPNDCQIELYFRILLSKYHPTATAHAFGARKTSEFVCCLTSSWTVITQTLLHCRIYSQLCHDELLLFAIEF